jgi:hypothetical protein
MNAIAEYLWPSDIAKDKVQTPVSILRAQAAHLGQKTSNLVEGRVDTLAREDRIYHRSKLVAPALDNYSYELFRISQPATMYPIQVEDEPRVPLGPIQVEKRILSSDDDFVIWLRGVLASEPNPPRRRGPRFPKRRLDHGAEALICYSR